LNSTLSKEAGELFKLELMVLQGTLERIERYNKRIIISEYYSLPNCKANNATG